MNRRQPVAPKAQMPASGSGRPRPPASYEEARRPHSFSRPAEGVDTGGTCERGSKKNQEPSATAADCFGPGPFLRASRSRARPGPAPLRRGGLSRQTTVPPFNFGSQPRRAARDALNRTGPTTGQGSYPG